MDCINLMHFDVHCFFCAVPENIHTPPTERFLFCTPLSLGNASLFSYIASENLAVKTPLFLGISSDLPWGGYGFVLELHIKLED